MASPAKAHGTGTRRRPRLVAMAALAALVVGPALLRAQEQPAPATPPDVAEAKPVERGGETLQQRIERWAKVDWEKLVEGNQLKFLQQLRRKCHETLVDFTATFYKHERIRGKLHDEEAALMKFRTEPFSVYMKYTVGDKGREVLYVNGKYDNKIQAHPGGVLGPLFQVKVAPDSDTALKDNLRPITMAGMTNMLDSVVPQFELALDNGDLKAEYLGKMDVGGRKAYAIKRILPQKDGYPCKELVFFVDCEALVPVGADSYGWDGQLESSYRYTDFKINVGLTDDDFDKSNKAYNF